MNSPIVPFLTMRMPEYVTVDDPSLEVLNLLRVVHSLNRYWGFLYHLVDYKPILSIHELINSKLTAKANRQLQVIRKYMALVLLWSFVMLDSF